MGLHVMWMFGQIVHNPVTEVLFHSFVIQLVPQDCQLNVSENTGKEHNLCCAPWLLQVRESMMKAEDDGVIHSHLSLLCKQPSLP